MTYIVFTFFYLVVAIVSFQWGDWNGAVRERNRQRRGRDAVWSIKRKYMDARNFDN